MIKRKLGIVLECVSGIDKLETLEIIKKTGFESTFTGEIDCERVKAIKQKADSIGIDLEFIHAPFDNINSMWLEGDD